MFYKKNAFTLVELIIVIIILSILGTIAFISLQGYLEESRDSARITDLSTISTSFELFQLDAGKYPLPTYGEDITYSGGLVWTQGIFGESVFSNVDSLDKIPKDPLTDSFYTYSVTSLRNEYQIAGIIETDLALNLFDNTYAGTLSATALVSGNYNGQISKSFSGTTCNVLSIPTIIATDIETSKDLLYISNNKKFVYDGYKNLPNSYRNTKYDVDGGFEFGGNGYKLVAYTDTGSCTELGNKTDFTYRVKLLSGIKESYSGTIIENTGNLEEIINLGIDVNNPSVEVQNYAGNFVNNNLGGNVEIQTNNNNIVNSYSRCNNAGDIIYASTIYGECDTNDIIVCTGKDTGITISACNVGTNVSGAYGGYFTNEDLWGNPYGLDLNRQSICEKGYHMPTISEWSQLHSAGGWGNDGASMVSDINLPMAGFIYWKNGSSTLGGVRGAYWSSSHVDENAYSLYFESTLVHSSPFFDYNRKNGFSIRCFRDRSANGFFVESPTSKGYESCTGKNTPTPFLSQSVYPGCDRNDIIVCGGSGTGITLSSCNVGTNISGVGSSSYGNMYQWGNNASIKYASKSNTQIGVNAVGSTYSNGVFIYDTANWNTVQNDNMWGDIPGGDIERRGPCAEGYHIPSHEEWMNLHNIGEWVHNGSGMSNTLKLPKAGFRLWDDASFGQIGGRGAYWSSSPVIGSSKSKSIYFSDTYIGHLDYERADGFAIRCFKN